MYEGIDLTQRGAGAGRNDDPPAPAACHQCTAEGNIGTVRVAGIGSKESRVFGDGEWLTSEHGLIELKRVCFEEPEIGGNPFAAFQQHHIARDDVAPGDQLFSAVM